MMVGIPLWVVSAAITKSLFIYPSVLNVAGYWLYRKYDLGAKIRVGKE